MKTTLTLQERIRIYWETKPRDWVMIPSHRFFDSHDIPKYKEDIEEDG